MVVTYRNSTTKKLVFKETKEVIFLQNGIKFENEKDDYFIEYDNVIRIESN